MNVLTRNVKLVLANRKEVQQLSNQLAIHALQVNVFFLFF